MNAQVSVVRMQIARHDLCLRAAAYAVVVLMSWGRSLLATSDCSMAMQVVIRMVTTLACIDPRTSTSKAWWLA